MNKTQNPTCPNTLQLIMINSKNHPMQLAECENYNNELI